MLPVWLLLKAGILGIAAAGLGIVYILRRGLNSREGGLLHPNAALGLVLFVGLILMSLTIDRVALPEGGVLLGLSIGLLGGP
jgi:hypothetical protein